MRSAKTSCEVCSNYNECRTKFMVLSELGLADIGKMSKDKTALHKALLKQIANYCSMFKRIE